MSILYHYFTAVKWFGLIWIRFVWWSGLVISFGDLIRIYLDRFGYDLDFICLVVWFVDWIRIDPDLFRWIWIRFRFDLDSICLVVWFADLIRIDSDLFRWIWIRFGFDSFQSSLAIWFAFCATQQLKCKKIANDKDRQTITSNWSRPALSDFCNQILYKSHF